MENQAGLATALIICYIAVLQLTGVSASASRTTELEAMVDSWRQERPEGEYRIKPKDKLDIRIEEACIYSTTFEVDERGFIEVPFADEVQAAGRSAAGLASEIERELRKYWKNPKVHVRVIRGRI